jgi:hypothetical protein
MHAFGRVFVIFLCGGSDYGWLKGSSNGKVVV